MVCRIQWAIVVLMVKKQLRYRGLSRYQGISACSFAKFCVGMGFAALYRRLPNPMESLKASKDIACIKAHKLPHRGTGWINSILCIFHTIQRIFLSEGIHRWCTEIY